MNTVEIKSIGTTHRGSLLLTEYTYVVTDPLGAKKGGTGAVAVSNQDAAETEISKDLIKRLGYSSFTVNFPAKPKDRTILGLKAG